MNPYLNVWVQGVKAGIAAYVEGKLPEGTTARTHFMLSLVRLQQPNGDPLPTLQDCAAEELRELRGQVFEALEMVDYIGQRGELDEGTARDRAIERVPEHLRDGLRRYVDEHLLPGQFLTAVLANDLFDALGRADIKSRAGLYDVVAFLYNHAPGGCYGNAERVSRWITPALPIIDAPGLGDELPIGDDGRIICPECRGWHPVHHRQVDPGKVTLPEDGKTKTAHVVDYVWCPRSVGRPVVVGIDGRVIAR
jgi:hypothetical protein